MRFDAIKVRGLGPFRDEVSLDLTQVQGPIVAVVGPNGAGKSTLLELFAAGLYREAPTRGSLAALATSRDAVVEVKAVNGAAYTIRHVVDAANGKGEAVVLDDTGAPLLTSAKLREFDTWAAAHLPPPQVLYSSTFAPQGSGGFLELKPGDRKAVLLRVLGIERLELLAERAREKARAAKAAVEVLAARIEDERARGGDVAALEAELAEATEEAIKADSAVVDARLAFRQAESEASDAAEALRAHQKRAADALALRSKASELDAKANEIARRLDASRAIVADAEAIREAVARIAEIDAKVAELGAEIARLEAEEKAAEDAMRTHEAAARAARESGSDARREAADIERKIANNRAVLENADAIRAAVARIAEIDARLAEVETKIVRLEGDERAERGKVQEHESAAQRARDAARAAEERRERAEARLADRQRVEEAVAGIEILREACEARDDEVAAIERQIQAVRELRISGAEQRIVGLRGGLTTIAKGLGDAVEIAVETITKDDRLTAEAAEAPVRERELADELGVARKAADEARRRLRDAEALAARAPELEAAARDAEAAAAECDTWLDEALRHGTAISEAKARVKDLALELESLRSEAGALRTEKGGLTELASKAEPLANATKRIAELEGMLAKPKADVEKFRGAAEHHEVEVEAHRTRATELSRERVARRKDRDDLVTEKARLMPTARRSSELEQAGALVAELEPRLAETRAEVERLRAQADEVTPKGDAPTTPDLEAAQRRVTDAERAARDAHGRVAVVARRIADARESAERLAGLEKERQATLDDLADWELLASSLGRDGLQALEIDAAGPELTALVNDLLRTCVGTRWTVSIETTRLSADGKKQLEGCEVRVIDTERGRDGTAESLSGGERVLVGEAISLALSMLACRRAGVQGPTLVRDESGAALDPVNARGYVAMLRRAAEIVGARHVLFVSHAPEIQELADARIVVRDGRVEVQA